ncbi:MAG TPA: ABC transporter permease, partial [bacterium]|nr:ABC transporter permease [bacterium]
TLDFIKKEIIRRVRKSIEGVLFILLGISIFVACQTINKALYEKTKQQLLRFGANIIVQPKGEPVDLYSGTMKDGRLIPETYVDKIRTISHNKMLIAVSPKLYERFDIGEKSLLVVGITTGERNAKPWWMIEQKVITDEFPEQNEILLGHYAASYFEDRFSHIELHNEKFKVSGVLDETGSPDDFMGFVPLATLQRLVKKKGMVNLIEVSTSCIACKAMNIHDVAEDIDKALPSDATVLLVKQIAEAQMGTLTKVVKFTKIIYVVVLALCAFLLMNYMIAAVDDRRREIGMLLAMGMDPRKIQVIFVSKLLIFAGVGGFMGYITGSGISIILGPLIAETKVLALPYLLPISFVISFGLVAISSIIPAKRISRLDPVEALREV